MFRCGRWLISVAVLAAASWAAAPRSHHPSPAAPDPHDLQPLAGFTSSPNSPSENRYVGVGSCSAGGCHGGPRGGKLDQYTVWIGQDRHAKTYEVLFDERSRRMVELLGITTPPNETERCLACHSPPPKASRGPRYSVADGVGCEMCHGPAEKWLEPHKRPDWKAMSAAAKFGSLGMTNTKDLAVRARICVDCHVGAPGREVNHELLAAGHPSLIFELDVFTARMPPHWIESPDAPLAGAKAWAVGQAVSLRQSLELLKARATDDRWPEFAEFECSACHHGLKKDSWRQQRGFGDRSPGAPVWNSPAWLLLEQMAAPPGGTAPGTAEFADLRKALGKSNPSAAEVARAADNALAAIGPLALRLNDANWDAPRLRRLLASLADSKHYEPLDYSTACHAAMAVAAIFDALCRIEIPPGAARPAWVESSQAAIDRLYKNLESASAFEPTIVKNELNAVRAALPREER